MPASFGRYEDLREVGRGGQAIVYAARDRTLGRTIALKILRPGARDAAARLLREARAVAKLNHPGIVAVYAAGECEGTVYLAMEFVQGRTLADALAGGALEPRAAIEIVARLAEAVHCAHGHGIVHRDVKPSNVLLPGEGAPKLTDFGFARDESARSTLTTTGEIVGSPAYMSPEQASGGARMTDARSDVYGLGAVLYEMLTGAPPFRAANPLALLDKIEREVPAAPSARIHGVPAAVDAICLTCLEKDPRRRYATAEELAEDCRRMLAGAPVRALPPSRARRIAARVRRDPAGAVAALAALALTAAMVWSSGARLSRAAAEVARAREGAAAAGLQAASAARVRDALRAEVAREEAAIERLRAAAGAGDE